MMHILSYSIALLLFATSSMAVSQEKQTVDPFPNNEKGAKLFLQQFLKPGADLKELTTKLRPTSKDYSMVFTAEIAKKLEQMYDQAWSDGAMVVSPNSGQTELLLFSATSEELQRWTGNAKEHFPGGYEKMGSYIANGNTFYRFKFVKPGESLGMSFDGLVYVNGHWRLFPKCFRVLDMSK